MPKMVIEAPDEFVEVGKAMAILDAIEHRQGTRAENVAREHARLSRRNLEMVLTDSEIFNRLPGSSLIKT